MGKKSKLPLLNFDWHNKEYDQFKTGLTYYEVWQVLRQEQEQGTRRHVTRHTVLGKWHEMKQAMYKAYFGDIDPSLYKEEEVPF